MRRSLLATLAVAFLMAITAVAGSTMAFTGQDVTATRPSGSPKARTPAALTEQIRIERRESFRNEGCSNHMRQKTPDV